LADADSNSKLGQSINGKVALLQKRTTTIWESEPNLAGVADGMARKMDRCAAIGNGQVPAVVALAWRTLIGNERT
ncbi:MAG: hypothetical protein ACEQSB_06135, partial [Undibacterium sp.]